MTHRLLYNILLPASMCTALLLHAAPLAAQSAPASPRPVFTLQQLKDSALHNNQHIRDARHDIAASREQRKEAFTKYFPQIAAMGLWFNADKGMAEMDINPSEYIPASLKPMLAAMPPDVLASLASPISTSMMKNGTIAGVNAVQPVYAGGQIVNGNKLARIGEEAADLKLQVSENEVLMQTEQYYWQLVSLREKGRTVDAVEEMLRGFEKDAATAVKAGVALRNDLLQVQLRRNEIQSQRLTLCNAMSLIKLLLAQHCGLRDTLFNIPADTLGNPVLTPRQDHEAALALTPEYRLLQKNVEASTLQHKLEVGKHLPSLAVGAGYNYHNLLDKDRAFGMVYATVSLPITDWWGGSHAIRRKKIAVEQAREQLTDNGRLLLVRMQKAWNDVEEAQQQFILARQAIEQATENLRILRDTYRAGTATVNALLQAQLLYQQTCDKRTDAYIACQTALITYRQATGQQ